MFTKPIFTGLTLVVLSISVHAADAPLGHKRFHPSPEHPVGWRGDGNGAFPGATPVTSFHEAPPQEVKVKVQDTWREPKERKLLDVGQGPATNIVWSTRMPAWAHAQPIIVGDKAFTMAEPHTLVCVDMNSGEILWQHDNSPFELMGLPENEVAALEDYIARVYAARVPIAARTGNYRRLPGHTPTKWKAEYREPVLEECELAASALRELVAENPHGAKAKPHLDAFLADVAKVKALKPGDRSKKLGKKLVGHFYEACEWIEKEHKVPCLFGWDGFIGWTFATPCSDGKRVYASMGQGQVVAYDLEGQRVWGVRIPNVNKDGSPVRSPRVRAKHVPSPVLAGGVLVAQAPDQLVGLDTDTGRVLWKEPRISVGGGYKVSSHKALRLDSGRWIIVTTAGKALDARTGAVVCDFGVKCYGSEGAGASIVGAGGVAYVVSSKKQTVAVAFDEDGGKLSSRILWKADCGPSGFSPVLFGDYLYRFNGRRRENKDVLKRADGSLVARLYPDAKGMSPSLIGNCIFAYDNGGTRDRLDRRNVIGITIMQLAGPTSVGKSSSRNVIDETAPPPDWRVEKHLPEVYERIKANKPPPTWAKKPWHTAWWGKCGGIPSGVGVGGFFASGNRVVLRTLSRLICIGDPRVPYDWQGSTTAGRTRSSSPRATRTRSPQRRSSSSAKVPAAAGTSKEIDEDKVLKALVKAVKGGESVRFFMSSMRTRVRVVAAQANGRIRLSARGMRLPFRFERLSDKDVKQLAETLDVD